MDYMIGLTEIAAFLAYPSLHRSLDPPDTKAPLSPGFVLAIGQLNVKWPGDLSGKICRLTLG